MADALGKTGDAKYYRDLHAKVGDSINRHFFDSAKGVYCNGSQFSNAFPLYLRIVPEDKRQQVLGALVDSVEVKHKGHLSTGFIGTPFLLDALVQSGRADIAYKIITQEDYPGWGYMVKNGATTVWELWELKTGNGMNSHNHPALGFVSAWFYRILAGINPDPSNPGWQRFSIKPYVLGDLKSAKASVDTVRGTVESDWHLTDNGILLKVTVPANSSAHVCLPKLGKEECTVKEGNSVIWKTHLFKPTQGIITARVDKDYVAFDVTSGHYTFELTGK
jgi:alpha-L-rhamnosidase